MNDLQVSNNKLTSLELVDLPKLIRARFDSNHLEKIKNIKNLPEIQKLYLQNNNIKSLSIANLPKLESFNIDKNLLEEIQIK